MYMDTSRVSEFELGRTKASSMFQQILKLLSTFNGKEIYLAVFPLSGKCSFIPLTSLMENFVTD